MLKNKTVAAVIPCYNKKTQFWRSIGLPQAVFWGSGRPRPTAGD